MTPRPEEIAAFAGQCHAALLVAAEAWHEMAESIVARDMIATRQSADRVLRQTVGASDDAAIIIQMARQILMQATKVNSSAGPGQFRRG